ncbi:hypothetical protein XI09_39140 [Bradyrhizobium sp. CCBAU 11386]|nr:hypothetical protein [Bradyrhizobium sp. CCBAU 11386]
MEEATRWRDGWLYDTPSAILFQRCNEEMKEMMRGRLQPHRHGRACPGHPRLTRGTRNVDARDKPGHDDLLQIRGRELRSDQR